MSKLLVYISGISFLASILFSCVPARKVEEIEGNYDRCKTERDALQIEKRDLESANTEMKQEIDKKGKEIAGLVSDTTIIGNSLRKMTKQYDKINKLNDELLKKQSELQKGADNETRKMLLELQALQIDLQKKEDELKDLELELDKRKNDLDKLSSELQNSQTELEKREARVKELEDLLASKDEAVRALKDKITEALLGYKDKGLTVEQRNGKIYVSMEAKLLFASGSIMVDPAGKKALQELAKVLEDQNDLEIMVEGHTDTDKMSGAGAIKDNWDLSVMRATSVVRILLENGKIEPERITAAGRSQFVPVDESDKAKNRRIEVVLTPNLDELFKILEK